MDLIFNLHKKQFIDLIGFKSHINPTFLVAKLTQPFGPLGIDLQKGLIMGNLS